PHVPWLEPDIVDHVDALADRGVPAVIVCPIGFVSDHLEVVWDLDTEAEQAARRHGMDFARAATPGTDPRFTRMILELLAEVRDGAEPQRLGVEPLFGVGIDGLRCGDACCPAGRRPQLPS
ncbi:MAG: ferrochelatase, partial [Rhodococcus sp.]|nr:ferrochelatase [Rhodococcus sp. (in: high G+C Gram-positive bacteria)]